MYGLASSVGAKTRYTICFSFIVLQLDPLYSAMCMQQIIHFPLYHTWAKLVQTKGPGTEF